MKINFDPDIFKFLWYYAKKFYLDPNVVMAGAVIWVVWTMFALVALDSDITWPIAMSVYALFGAALVYGLTFAAWVYIETKKSLTQEYRIWKEWNDRQNRLK